MERKFEYSFTSEGGKSVSVQFERSDRFEGFVAYANVDGQDGPICNAPSLEDAVEGALPRVLIPHVKDVFRQMAEE